MSMHDKENMDNLFRLKLDDLAVEPSAKVWTNVSRSLNGNNGRRSVASFLRIAASIVIVLTAGLLFLLKEKKVNKVQPKNELVRSQSGKKPVVVQQVVVAPSVNKTSVNKNIQSQQIAKVQPVKRLTAPQHATAITKKDIKPAETIVAMRVIQQDNKIQLKDSITSAIMPALITENKPNMEILTQLRPKDVIQSNEAIKEKPEPVKKHGIRGLGGLINAVVGSVDKRPDKIIEFTDTDEGNSLTGINLGIIRIKKQN